MTRPSSVLCPSCGTLVGVKDPECLNCGRRNPGMWGLAHLLRGLGDDMGFTTLVMWACGALYLASLAVDLEGIRAGGHAVLPVPEHREPVPLRGERGGAGLRLRAVVDGAQRGWLHGGVLHILFNLYWVRNLAPPTAHLYGPGASGDHLHRLRGRRLPRQQRGRRVPPVPALVPPGAPASPSGRPRPSSVSSGRCSTTGAAAAAATSASRRRASRSCS